MGEVGVSSVKEDWEGERRCTSQALLYKVIFGPQQVWVVISAMPVLRFVPVIRVFSFTCDPLSFPFPLPLPSPVLGFFILPVVAVPPFFSLTLPSPPWKGLENKK